MKSYEQIKEEIFLNNSAQTVKVFSIPGTPYFNFPTIPFVNPPDNLIPDNNEKSITYSMFFEHDYVELTGLMFGGIGDSDMMAGAIFDDFMRENTHMAGNYITMETNRLGRILDNIHISSMFNVENSRSPMRNSGQHGDEFFNAGFYGPTDASGAIGKRDYTKSFQRLVFDFGSLLGSNGGVILERKEVLKFTFTRRNWVLGAFASSQSLKTSFGVIGKILK